MYCLHGVSLTQHDITLVAEAQDGAQQKNTAGNTQSFCIDSTEYRIAFDQAVYDVQKDICTTSKFEQGAVGNNSCVIFFRHPINFLYMEFHDP